MFSRALLAVSLTALAMAITACTEDADPSSIPTAAPSAPEASGPPEDSGCGADVQYGVVTQTLEAGGIQREYRAYVPRNYDPARPTPLVLNFHGLDSNAFEQEQYANFEEKSEDEGFIVVSPEGTNDPKRWYISGPFEPGYTDDGAFIDTLLDELGHQYCLDAKRIYATGISNGAGLASLVACDVNHRIAAIAPVAGSPYSDSCNQTGPMPIVSFHGTSDWIVPFKGGLISLAPLSARENLERWARHNGCNMELRTQRIADDVMLESYEGCTDGADTRLYVIEGGGHTWPGAAIPILTLGRTTQSIDATDIIWDFFEAHPKR